MRELAPATCSRSKAPSSEQTISCKKIVVQQNYCSRILLHWIKLVKYKGASSRSKSVAGACCRSKLPHVYRPVWRTQLWPPRVSFIQVFDRFLTSLMDRMIKSFLCPPDLCLFSCGVIGSLEINSHHTCQKLVKNLYKTYAWWPRLDMQDCKSTCFNYEPFQPQAVYQYFISPYMTHMK